MVVFPTRTPLLIAWKTPPGLVSDANAPPVPTVSEPL